MNCTVIVSIFLLSDFLFEAVLRQTVSHFIATLIYFRGAIALWRPKPSNITELTFICQNTEVNDHPVRDDVWSARRIPRIPNCCRFSWQNYCIKSVDTQVPRDISEYKFHPLTENVYHIGDGMNWIYVCACACVCVCVCVAYSSQGSHTSQLGICNWKVDRSTVGCD